MPHIKLEHTANVRLPREIRSLFAEIHQLIHTVAAVDIANCKSRLYQLDNFWVGDGAVTGSDKSASSGLAPAFVHLEVRFVEGRAMSVKNSLAEKLKELLLKHLAGELGKFELQVTVEVSDILLNEYAKYPAGSLTRQQVC